MKNKIFNYSILLSILFFSCFIQISNSFANHAPPAGLNGTIGNMHLPPATHGKDLIIPNMTPSLTKIGTMNFVVGDSVTLDLSKATIATGKIDSYSAGVTLHRKASTDAAYSCFRQKYTVGCHHM